MDQGTKERYADQGFKMGRMAKKAKMATPWGMYAKMGLGGAILCIGGPLFTWWMVPSEEELFLKYNPELQKRSLENRYQKQKDFDDFVNRLKEYSKSDKPIWEVQAQAEKLKKKEEKRRRALGLKPGEEEKIGEGPEMKLANELLKQKQKLREDTGPLVPGGSL